ncbi:MAG: DUF2974 domain-containing protein [Saccharofermentans sp.]|nr:DUF2974 domain-containing protein [Saccharofermentans sp.]
MNTIFDYLEWRGDLTLEQAPFNDVDAAILARFCYEPFDGIVSESFRKKIKVEDACNAMLNIPNLDKKLLIPKEDTKLIQVIARSKRFSSMKMSGYINDIDLQRQTQFSAVVFDLDNEHNYYVAFRGTDNTLIGWKEDFNMGFDFPVPAQITALEYFEEARIGLKEGTFILGGHSKGGNLAIYASAFASCNCQDTIRAIYNFDGPGFTETIYEREQFLAIEDKVRTFVPEFSIVGMILEHSEDYSVVSSNALGFMQHEPLSWEVARDSFPLIDRVAKGSKFIDHTLKDWLSGLSMEEREKFVDTIYSLLTSGNKKKVYQLGENKLESANALVKTYAGLDDKTKKALRDITFKLLKSAGNTITRK